MIAIATLSDWLKRVAPVFQPMRSKSKTMQSHDVRVIYPRALIELKVIAGNCDWFMALWVPVVVGRSNFFGFGFSTVI